MDYHPSKKASVSTDNKTGTMFLHMVPILHGFHLLCLQEITGQNVQPYSQSGK